MGANILRRVQLERQIAQLCRQAGCDEKKAERHRKQFVEGRWHMHPPKLFVQWWEPWGFDNESGASIGGHTDAWRKWARPRGDGTYAHGWYGIETVAAWNARQFFEEYREWLGVGAPLRATDFISICASAKKQKAFWKNLKPLLDRIVNKRPWSQPTAVTIWNDEKIPDTPDFQTHIEWLETKRVNPPIIHKKLEL